MKDEKRVVLICASSSDGKASLIKSSSSLKSHIVSFLRKPSLTASFPNLVWGQFPIVPQCHLEFAPVNSHGTETECTHWLQFGSVQLLSQWLRCPQSIVLFGVPILIDNGWRGENSSTE